MTESLESAIRVEGNRRIRVRKPRTKPTSTSNDQPIPTWEVEAKRLHSLVQRTPDSETLVQLTESVSAIQEAIEALEEAGKCATEFTKFRKLIPNTYICTIIRPDLMVAERRVDGILEAPSRFVPRSMLYPSERILSIKRSLQIDIWIKQPRRLTCEGIIRAFQAGELDVESFLAWFREQTMGLLGPELDPYIAEVLLGMRVSGGEILLPGDMQNLAGLGEQEIIEVIVARANALRRSDDNGTRDRVRVLAPGEQKNDRMLDALYRVSSSEPVDQLFVSHQAEEWGGIVTRNDYGQLRRKRLTRKPPEIVYEVAKPAVALAFIKAAKREQWERIGRAAGLTRKESRFLHLRGLGKVTKRDDERLWRAVNAKMPAIKKALEDLRFGQIS